jgi:hypothetical protein
LKLFTKILISMKKNLLGLRYIVSFTMMIMAGFAFSQQTYTFTSAGVTGSNGPTQADINSAYSGTNLAGNVTVNGGIQSWTVPSTGSYRISAFGAQGGGAFGGLGAQIEGDFNLTAGQVINILVGQQGQTQAGQPNSVGGGGGTFVVLTPGTSNADILVIAGGGGGSASNAYASTANGSITNNGNNGVVATGVSSPNGAGGIAGNGGSKSVSGCSLDRGSGGGGFFTNGESICQSSGVGNGGLAFVNGGAGGSGFGPGASGGFGGGGATWQTGFRGSGGGGGYSGGGAGQINSNSPNHAGGGGGSFNAGTNPLNVPGVQSGAGQVIIALNCIPNSGSLTPDAANLPDVTAACVVTSLTPPTASNSCTGGYEGVPDVTLPFNTVGTTVVTWTFNDGVNTTTQTQNIVINGIDNDPPVLDNASLLTYSSQCSFMPPIPTATDICAGTVLGTPDIAIPVTTQGTNTITWTFDDGSGNTVTQTQTIIIDDIAAPILDVETLAPFQGCNSVTPPAPTATDNCLGTMNGVPDVTFPITTSGTTSVTWTFDDGHGNVTTQMQDVIVGLIDNSVSVAAPTITANQAQATYQWIDCESGLNVLGATDQSFTPNSTGEYAVIVTTGSCTDTSECTLIDYTSVASFNNDNINIYPNPTSGLFTIDFDGQIDDIRVIDALGRTIELPVDLATGAVDGSVLETGRYTVRVFAKNTIYTKSMIVTK